MKPFSTADFGISAISFYEPPCSLDNDWFRGVLARKFVQHTGTQARRVSFDDEVTMALRAACNLRRETGCDLRDCAALVFVSPSFIPLSVARGYLGREGASEENVQHAAEHLTSRLGTRHCRAVGVNWFCAGYTKALAVLHHRILPALALEQHQFGLVVTATRISRITDYECRETASLFGDFATATLVAPATSRRHPIHFHLLDARAEQRNVDGVYFRFHRRENVLAPNEDGGQVRIPQRLVFSLNGMGIADTAPRAMSQALAQSLSAVGLQAGDVRHVVPHQAGTAIVRLTTMKLEELGIRAQTANGITGRVGNLSSSSIPFALKQLWQDLHGTIACPTAAVGNPGEAKMAQGCLILQSTPHHDKQVAAA